MLFLPFGNTFGDSAHIVTALSVNSNPASYLLGIFLYGILPVATALGLLVIIYAKDKENRKRIFSLWPMTLLTGFCAILGVFLLRVAIGGYSYAVEQANRLNMSYLTDSLSEIYVTYGMYAFSWIATASFLLACTLVQVRHISETQRNESKPEARSSRPIQAADRRLHLHVVTKGLLLSIKNLQTAKSVFTMLQSYVI
jgi:hypothetical protein